MLRMRRARAAYFSVDKVSAASTAAPLTHATITVWELPPRESCKGHPKHLCNLGEVKDSIESSFHWQRSSYSSDPDAII